MSSFPTAGASGSGRLAADHAAKTRSRGWQIVVVLLLFSALGVVRHLHNFGEDLASSYVGCRLLASGEGDRLYSHSATRFTDVADPVWYAEAQRTGFTELRLLHPYVQTPLWAYALEPVCTRMQFRAFCDGFIVVLMLCTSALLWLVARYWTPSLWHPGWMALVCAGLYVSEPFKYAIFLAQTHVIFVLLAVAALILAERGKQGAAGVLLAMAAAVKITPGLLVLYWLFTRRYRAAVSFAVGSLLLAGLAVATTGRAVMQAYLGSLRSNADVLLLAFNNQSLAAWWMGLRAPAAELAHWYTHPLPAWLKVLSLLLVTASSVLGGWMDRQRYQASTRLRMPLGAVFAMVGATLFTPIAWTHYSILLVIPVMFFLEASRFKRPGEGSGALPGERWFPAGCALVVPLLNLYPISYGAVHLYWKPYTLARSQFYAGVFCLLALAALRLRSAPAARVEA